MPWPSKLQMTQLAFSRLGSSQPPLPSDGKAAPPTGPMKLGAVHAAPTAVQTGAAAEGVQLTRYVDGICGAICTAMDVWLRSTALAGVVVQGPVATGGTLTGPGLQPLVLASGPKATDMDLRTTRAVADVLGESWYRWQAGVKVGGMPWYPLFAAAPGPLAPLIPNIPCPLGALASVDEAALMTPVLEQRMTQRFGPVKGPYGPALFGAIAFAFFSSFMTFKATTMVKNVLGTGPVPSWAPPRVPLGPVVGGTALGAPGFLA